LTDEEGQEETLESKAGLPPLPAGWTSAIEPKSGKTFYVDHNKKLTTWKHPLVEKKKKEKKSTGSTGGLTPDAISRQGRAGSSPNARSRSKSPSPQTPAQAPAPAPVQQPAQPLPANVPAANPLNPYATNKLERYNW